MNDSVVVKKKAMPIDVEAGKTYYWCACGKSANLPFCDGAHKGSGVSPVPYKAEQAGKAYFCGCGITKNAPLCDGAHKSL